MNQNDDRPQLAWGGRHFGLRRPGLLTRILAFAAGVVVLAAAVAISIVVFAVVLAALLLFGIYVWWKTRDLRRQMRAQRADNDVIEGEFIRKDDPDREKPPRGP